MANPAATSFFPSAAGALATGAVTTTEILDDTITSADIHDVAEADFAFTDVTTADASTTKHGLVVKATAPAANVLGVVGIGNGETAYTVKTLFDGTNPAALGTAGPGTSLSAAHRDHIHTLPAIDATAAATDITTRNASTSAHGLLPKLSNVATEYIGGTGLWSTPATDITGMTQLTTSRAVGADPLTDECPVYDASAAANRKVKGHEFWAKMSPICDLGPLFDLTVAPYGWTKVGTLGDATSGGLGGAGGVDMNPSAATAGLCLTDTDAIPCATMVTRLRVMTYGGSDTTGGSWRVGFANNADPNTDAVAGAYFRWSSAVNSGKFECVTRNASTETATDSTISQSGGAYLLEIESTVSTNFKFYINGTLVATNTTNLPTVGTGIVVGQGGGQVGMYCLRIACWIAPNSNR